MKNALLTLIDHCDSSGKNGCRNNLIGLIFCLLTLSLLTGCGGEKKPEGMPNLFPCTITLTQENAPLEGANVMAVSDDPQLARWPVTGITDANGSISFVTYGKFKGVPEGDYTLLVIKEETVEQKPKVVDATEHRQGPVKFYSLVDPKLGEKNSSTLKIKVEKKKNHFEFDTGKKIRLEKKMGAA